jgi:arylsulfatase A-like enzyme
MGPGLPRRRALAVTGALIAAALGCAAAAASAQPSRPRNVVIILSDDHRHDFMGFTPGAPPWLRTPSLDRMRREGAHVRNAFVTTSLCSPSRASILTGQYAHRHGVVDNSSPIPPGVVFFPQHLQRAGYATAYIGKWHMGEDAGSDRPRPGFDHWISFRGQGVYVDPTLNVNGRASRVAGYTTDVLTDSAVAWLGRQGEGRGGAAKPFLLVLAHKATHAEFLPAPRHAGRYEREPIPYPATMARTEANARGKPRWVLAQRDGWHGVDFAYHGAMDFDAFYRRYAETLLSLDESIGRVLDALVASGLDRSTLVLYMSDNGFVLGEHGLIDKRHAYEASIRIPMLAWAPGWIAPGSTAQAIVRNIDIAPTVLELAGVRWPERIPLDGRSVLGALRGDDTHPHDLRPPRRPLQVHPLPRGVGHERALRPGDRLARAGEPRGRPRVPRHGDGDARAPLRPARGNRRDADPAPARRLAGGRATDPVRGADPRSASRGSAFPPFSGNPRNHGCRQRHALTTVARTGR